MKFKLIFILIIILSFNSVNAQCPTNLAFDAGNLSFWSYYPGTYPGSNGRFYPTRLYSVFNGPPAKATTSQSQLGRDNNIGINVIKASADGSAIPDVIQKSIAKVPTINGYKYDYSIKLGNNQTGAYADKATYIIDVPSGVSTYNITYAYALILQDPGHNAQDQPKFRASVIDLTNDTKIDCASKEYYVGDGQTYLGSGSVRYIDWQEVSFDLSQYEGKKIELRFEMFDCSLGGHYGYGYIALRNDGCGTGTISGDNIICSSSTALTYSTAQVDGASYTWTMPVGWTGSSTSNSITVNPNGNSGGNITVTPSQSCGNITTRALAVSAVSSAPATPGTIQGDASVCANSNNIVYTVPAVTNASSYTWTYPSDWTIVSGLNSNTITFNAGTSTGTITVLASNSCDNSATTSSPITITNNTLSLAGTITGNSSLACPNVFSSLTLGTSTGTITNWLSSTDGGISWSNIANTSSSYSITPSSSTLYKAVVKNGVCAQDESDAFLVNVYSPIQILNQPTSINTCSGQSVNFSVSAIADGTLSYDWQVSSNSGGSWASISASPTYYSNYNTSSLTVSNTIVIIPNNGIQYRCIVSSSVNCETVTSTVATLNVSSSTTPVIVTQPAAQTFCIGAVAKISVNATGPSLSYQWQTAISSGGTYSNVGSNSNELSITTSGVSSNYYKCVITENCGSESTTSNIAKIDVSTLSVASATISSTVSAVCAGTPKTFTVTPVNGGAAPVYAWYKNGSLVSGQTSSTYATSSLINGDVVYVTLTSNQACAVGSPASSANISTTVNPTPSISVTGTTTNITSVSLTASGGITYVWDGGSSLNTSANTFDGSGSYSVTVTGSNGCISSTIVNVTVQHWGLSRNGEKTLDSVIQISSNGQKGSENPLSNNGNVKEYRFKNKKSVGDSYGGGIVAYIFQPGDAGYVAGQQHGLIISSSFSGIGDVVWGTGAVSGTSQEIGYGSTNTDKIIAAIGSNSAAGLARSHRAGGYTDWYLPSFKDLQKIYFNINRIPSGSNLIGGPSKWSSYTSGSGTAGAVCYCASNLTEAGLAPYSGLTDDRTTSLYRVIPVRNF